MPRAVSKNHCTFLFELWQCVSYFVFTNPRVYIRQNKKSLVSGLRAHRDLTCASAFLIKFFFCYEKMSNSSQNCWIDWNSAVLCFKRFVRTLFNSHHTLYMGNLVTVYTCITYFPVGKTEKRPETGDFFCGPSPCINPLASYQWASGNFIPWRVHVRIYFLINNTLKWNKKFPQRFLYVHVCMHFQTFWPMKYNP